MTFFFLYQNTTKSMKLSSLKNASLIVIGLSSGLVLSGYLTGVLTIPTNFATHEAKLTELHI
jgi:hypothetical protein